jgi:hypothetical protein
VPLGDQSTCIVAGRPQVSLPTMLAGAATVLVTIVVLTATDSE